MAKEGAPDRAMERENTSVREGRETIMTRGGDKE